MMNTFVAGLGLLIALAFTIYILGLATKLVRAVEKIANQSKME